MIQFSGYIEDVSYTACVIPDTFPRYALSDFEVNAAKPYGVLQLAQGEIAYSKWVSPKRTRSYPFERIYNTYNFPMRVTIIPVIKDEGADGDFDRIQFSTVSWMSLLNVYIVLAYYERADKNQSSAQRHKHKLTRQRFDTELVREQLAEVARYKQSAYHWNRNLFERQYTDIYRKALDAYEQVSKTTQVRVHERQAQDQYLQQVTSDFAHFQNVSAEGSARAAQREVATLHRLELLRGGEKASLRIQNYMRGEYHLTADEVFFEEGKVILQESKNASTGRLPALSDIRDGLFKLILYSNLSRLEYEGVNLKFETCLCLTGKQINGSITLPTLENELLPFLEANPQFSQREKGILNQLRQEVSSNPKITVTVSGHA
ncbi:MAG: hypothetical protein OHK0029_21890 [Armatimonadaceae bacterium]